MNPVPSLSAFWSSTKGALPHDVNPSARIDDGAGDQPFPSTALPTRKERRVALAVVLVSVAIFAIAVPFAGEKLPEFWGFIPIYQSALTINELVTAALLFAQFSILRSRALLVLACGYSVHGWHGRCPHAVVSGPVCAGRADRLGAADHSLAVHVLARGLPDCRDRLCQDEGHDLRAARCNPPLATACFAAWVSFARRWSA